MIGEQSDSSSSDSSSSSSLEYNSNHNHIPLNIVLDKKFSSLAKNFNIVHINAQSIPAHFTDMLTTFEINNIHAVLVSESWFKPCLSSTSYSLPGFKLIRNDRIGKGGGGVAIYLREHIPFNTIRASQISNPSNEAEFLFLEVILAHTKILLGVFYSPSPTINYFSSLENVLEELTPTFNHVIFMGDFNTCRLRDDHRSKSLTAVAEACNLKILPLQATHFFPDSKPSLLDLMLVSSLDHVKDFGQFPAAFSFHDLIYLSYNIRPPKLKSRTLMQRNFGSIDTEKLREDAAQINWDSIIDASSVDEQVELFSAALIQLYDRHAPVRPVRVRHLPAPWLTDDIKKLIHRKNHAKAKYKSNPMYREIYVQARNHCNRACREAQRRHIHKSVENGSPAKIWKFLKSLGIGKNQNKNSSYNVNINDLNRHFSTPPVAFDSDLKTNTLNSLSSLPTPDYSPFIFSQFTQCDVKQNILAVSSDAVGADSISRKMILPILDIILPVITSILNFSISSGMFPTSWKDAFIIPIPKKNNPSSFFDYRPISILPLLSKVLERLIHDQLNRFLTLNKLLDPYQSGFRKGHSTTTALIKISDDIRLGMEKSQLTVLTLLDFSNAFNAVDFDILLQIMRSLNISPLVIDWFYTYLFGRRQRLRIDDTLSSWCAAVAGVPQGGVLSPLLFALFINSITSKLLSSYHLYADDLQIYSQAAFDNVTSAIQTANDDLKNISNWSKSYGIIVNPSKTQTIIIGSPSYISRIKWKDIPAITFDGTQIPFRDRVRNLGILFDSTLSWWPQINEGRIPVHILEDWTDGISIGDLKISNLRYAGDTTLFATSIQHMEELLGKM
ncbi:RNA-directed DNA polymerase from mobile element jockey [Aphomia sociella]